MTSPRRRARPLRLAAFFFALPDALPIPHGAIFGFVGGESVPGLEGFLMKAEASADPAPPEMMGRMFVSLRFWQVMTKALHEEETAEALMKVVDDATGGVSGKQDDDRWKSLALDDYMTVVEAVTPFRDRGSPDLGSGLNRCIDQTVDFVRVLRIAKGLLIPPLSRERMYFMVPCATRPLSSFEFEFGPLTLLHHNVRVAASNPEMSEEDRYRFDELHFRLQAGHPLMAFSERGLDAHVAANVRGDYQETVISAETAMESLLDGILMMMLWEEGVDPQVAATLLEESFSYRVRTAFSGRLGGDWNVRGKGPIGRWGRQLYPVRGRVVHTAYRPSEDEARAALATLAEVEEFVKKRLVAKRFAYPKATFLTLGRAGLDRLGGWSKRFDATVRAQPSVPPQWILDFGRWRAEIT